MTYNIPLIDFAKCGLLVSEDGVTERNFIESGNELYAALSKVGFAYLINHGIEWTLIDEMNEVGERFYSLPLEVKEKFQKPGFALSYDSVGRTQSFLGQPDYQEGLRVAGEAYNDDNIEWPDVPSLKECYTEFANIASKLLLRLLTALGHGMKLKDREYFCQVHSLMNQKGNYSTAKTIKYPPIDDENKATENRIGEHADRTTLTLLFQDDKGGLQVKDVSGKLVDVHPIPESIVINIGGIFETWSGNRLKATKHRVTAPLDPIKRGQVRRSVIYFAHANQDALMTTLEYEDDFDKDEIEIQQMPLTVHEYMYKSLSVHFKDEL